ncbi:MAG TPA: biopolymer transporter ExbD [Alphaproteobacteria bacterium]|nr:biopolymer transporter ExbD [Alphaproteobacteria bacterium]
MRPRPWRRSGRDASDVDVTAFLSLMVILVPFLLITAVFTRVTALEVAPPAAGEPSAAPDALQLQVIVRHDAIEVHHRGQARGQRLPWTEEGGTLRALAGVAHDLKRHHPDSAEVTVLVEPQIPYERLVQVLDALRVKVERTDGAVTRTPLFPLIALGPAQPTRQWLQGAR